MTPRLPDRAAGLTTAGSRWAVRANTVASGTASSTASKAGTCETIVAEPLPRFHLVTASLDRIRRVPFDTEPPRRVCGKHSRPIANRDHAVGRHRQRLLEGAERLRQLVEPHRDRAIAPGILKTIAAVGRDPQVDTKRGRGVVERANLVAGRGRKEKNAPHGQIRAACPSVGSAQQYQGSVRYGTRGWRDGPPARLVSA